jgi:enterochelin esterase-like enzyme
MKKLGLIITVFSIAIQISLGQNDTDSLYTTIGHSVKIESEILKQSKTVYIHLPYKFDSNNEYPLVILSDFMAFKPLSSITEIMAYNKTIPPCIVVCPVTTNARVDYSPIIDDSSETINGGKTMAFFEKELIPFLESKYKISKRIIWGQSYSGMFTTFIFLSNPDLFDGYLSDVPQLDKLKNEIESENCFKNFGDSKVFYQISWTTLADKTAEMNNFLNKLKSDSPDNLKWKFIAQSDSISMTHIVTNYTYGLDAFFKEIKK